MLLVALSIGFGGCDAGDDTPADTATEGGTTVADGPATDDGADTTDGETPANERTCVPQDDDDLIAFDEAFASDTKYCPPQACANADGGCPTPEFAAQTFASASDENAAQCVLEHLRDRVPGRYAYMETDNELYGYRTDLFVFEGGLVIEQVSGSDESTTTFVVSSGELDPPSDFTTCLDAGSGAWATCLRSAVAPGNPISLGDLSCPP